MSQDTLQAIKQGDDQTAAGLLPNDAHGCFLMGRLRYLDGENSERIVHDIAREMEPGLLLSCSPA